MSRRFVKRLKSILKRKAGFSMAELLVAMLIMLLATGALTMTINLAVKHFYKSIQESEAQVLCATLSEFVEDELLFANVVNGSTYKWSGGTHNMGDGIAFYIEKDSSYTQVDNTSLSTEGQIVITGNNYAGKHFKAANSASYEVGNVRNYDLAAAMKLEWRTDKRYKVTIKVVDKSDSTELSRSEFTVKPIVVS